MQDATILFNDRVNSYMRMKEIDAVIDEKPTARLVAELAEMRIRNLIAYEELQSFNDTGTFLFKHVLVKSKSEHARLNALLMNDSSAFMRELDNSQYNVKRYSSFLNRQNLSLEDKKRYAINLSKHEEKVSLMQCVIDEIKR